MTQKMLTEYKYNCKICYQPFPTTKLLICHEYEEHSDKCDICGVEICFCIIQQEKQLLKNCKPRDIAKCIFCENFFTLNELGIHLKKCYKKI